MSWVLLEIFDKRWVEWSKRKIIQVNNKDASSFTANDITTGPNSDELVVKQGLFKKEIGITEVEATFSVVRLDTVIRRKLDQYFRNTLMNYIRNNQPSYINPNISEIKTIMVNVLDNYVALNYITYTNPPVIPLRENQTMDDIINGILNNANIEYTTSSIINRIN